MNIAVIYRCSSDSDIEKIKLSIEQFKDKNRDNQYQFLVSCDDSVSEIPEKTDDVEFVKMSPVTTIQKIAQCFENYRFVITSDVCTVINKSIEPLLEELNSLDSYWQTCGNMEFSYTTVSNGTNMKVCSDYANSYISSRFCIFNSYFANLDTSDYYDLLEYTDGNGEDELEELLSENSGFYDTLNLLINAVNWERIVMPEIVYQTGYNLKDLHDGIVAVIDGIDEIDAEKGMLVCNNYVYLPVLYQFIQDNEFDISDKYKKNIELKSIVGHGNMLHDRHLMEYIDAKVGTKEWNLVM